MLNRINPTTTKAWKALEKHFQEMEAVQNATSQALPGKANNQYLFAGFGESTQLRLQTASRRWLLLASSGVLLALALLTQLFPWSAQRWIVWPLAGAVCAAAWLHPSPTIIVAQAAVFGIVVAVFARLIHWTFHRRRNDRYSRDAQSAAQMSRSATILRGSSIHAPRSTDAMSISASSQR